MKLLLFEHNNKSCTKEFFGPLIILHHELYKNNLILFTKLRGNAEVSNICRHYYSKMVYS